MKSSVLDGFRLTVAEKHLGVYGIRVEDKSGESATHFWRSDNEVNLYSASKTFSSLAAGLCASEGRFCLTDKILDFFPEFRSAAAKGSGDITLRDLLHMESGKLQFWFGESEKERDTKDWAELFFRVPVTKKPGTFFYYSNACTYMVGRAIEKVTGQNVRDFLLPRLFRPLGILNPQWHSDPAGHTLCATQLFLTLGQFARLGTLLLHGGVFRGKRLVEERYLQEMTTDTVKSGGGDPESLQGYGYQIWLCTQPGSFRADGAYGQFCVLLPQQGVAVTITSHEERRTYDILRSVFEDILPRLSESTATD